MTASKFGFNETDEKALQKEYDRDRKEKDKVESNVPTFFLESGITQLRILPPAGASKVWFHEVKKIWVPVPGTKQNKPYISPLMFSNPCPFVEEGKRLFAAGGAENIEKAKKFRPRNSYLFNVLVYSTPSQPDHKINLAEGVKVLDAPTTVKKALLDLNQDVAGGWGNITSLEEGIDIRIEKRGSGQFDTEYFVKGVPARKNVIQVLESHGLNPETILKPHDLGKTYYARDYDDLKKVLDESQQETVLLPSNFNTQNTVVDNGSPGVTIQMPVSNPAVVFDVPAVEAAPTKE